MGSVSVVIPTYNRARWLTEAVASALAQTVPPLEVLIVDDGSTDDTEAVAATFAPPVRYIRQRNAGVAAARNRGIREARGDLVALLDSDDVWEPSKLAVQLAVLDAHPEVGWCLSDCEVIDADGRALPPPQGFVRVFAVFEAFDISPDTLFARHLRRAEVEVAGARHRVYVGDAFEPLFLGNFGLPSSAVFRRALLEAGGEYDEQRPFAEETEHFHRLAAKSPVGIVMSPLVRYRVGQAQQLTANSNTPRLIRLAIESLDRAAHLRGGLSPAQARAYRAGRGHLMYRLAYDLMTRFDGRGARATLAEAWRSGVGVSPGSVAIYAASLLPAPVLRMAHALKRAVRG